MTASSLQVAHNTLFFTLALVVQKIFSFFYFAFLARMLAVGEVGKYLFAISFTTIFTIFIDLGFSTVLTREVAKNRENAQPYFSNILFLKLITALFVLLLVNGIIFFLNYPLLTRELVALSSIAMVLDSFTLSFWSLFRGRHNLSYESMANVLFQLIVVGLGSVVLLTSKNLLHLMSTLALASLVHFLFALIMVKRKIGIRFRFEFHSKILKTLFLISYPFALAAIFNRVYLYFDSVLLSKLVGDEAVAFYGAAYKFILAIQFIPLAFSAAIFPAMSALFLYSKESLLHLFEKSSFYLMMISFPIVFFVFSLSDKIIPLVYGNSYQNSIPVLQILILSLVFLFCNYPVGALLNAGDRQLTNTFLHGGSMAISLLLNFLLIPLLSYHGAAIAFLTSTTVLYLSGLFFARKILNYRAAFFLKNILRIGGVSFLLALVVYEIKDEITVFVLLPLYFLSYLLLLMITKTLRFDDIKTIFFLLKRTPIASYEKGTSYHS